MTSIAYRQTENFRSSIADQLRMFGEAVRALSNYKTNSVFGKFRVSLSSYGYGNDGNTIICDEAHETFWIDLVVHRHGITWVRVCDNAFPEGDDAEFEMTGNHSSCYFDSWDQGIVDKIVEAADNLLPNDYWELENTSTRPISVFTTIDRLSIIEDPQHECMPISDHTFSGYDHRLVNISCFC